MCTSIQQEVQEIDVLSMKEVFQTIENNKKRMSDMIVNHINRIIKRKLNHINQKLKFDINVCYDISAKLDKAIDGVMMNSIKERFEKKGFNFHWNHIICIPTQQPLDNYFQLIISIK